MNFDSNWYKYKNFFRLSLIDDKFIYWVTEKSMEEIEQEIKENSFVDIFSIVGPSFEGENNIKKTRHNTKSIITIEDVSELERSMYAHNNGIIERKLELIAKIRNSKPSFFTRRRISEIDSRYSKKELTLHEKTEGYHLDPLVYFQLWELEKMLKKCK